MKIVLATNNQHKAEEFSQIFSDQTILLPGDLGLAFSCDETGSTFIENSLQKALSLSHLLGNDYYILADDSGLSVEALNFAPGIFSARYGLESGIANNDKSRLEFLLQNLGNNQNRKAYFTCALSLISPRGQKYIVEERFFGSIAKMASGNSGFGYDPIFIPENKKVTLAECTINEKNTISHRALACKAMKAILGIME